MIFIKKNFILFLLYIMLFFIPVHLRADDVSINIKWDANSESDLSGYVIYWGTLPGRYSNERWIGNNTDYTIRALRQGIRYYIAVKAVDFWGNLGSFSREVSAVAGDPLPLPDKVSLADNFPNPFNPGTFIEFSLPEMRYVNLDIYNNIGQKVITLKSGFIEPGLHHVYWNGENSTGMPVSAGVYFYVLDAGDQIFKKKMTHVK